jgi:hypothetical protein
MLGGATTRMPVRQFRVTHRGMRRGDSKARAPDPRLVALLAKA